MEGELSTWQKRRITEVEKEADASFLLPDEGEAVMPPEAERNARAHLTLGNSGTPPLSSPLLSLLLLPLHYLLRGPPVIYQDRTTNQWCRVKRGRPNRKERDRDQSSIERR